MKKGIAFLICAVCLLMWCTPLSSALDVLSGNDTHESLRENSITYHCSYDQEKRTIEISGTVNHDVMILHSDFTIAVYRILPGQSPDDIMNNAEAEAVASAAIAIKFHFSVDARRVADRFSRYAIVLISSDGERILAAQPQYAGVETTYSYDKKDRLNFKGIESEQSALVGNLGTGTAIVPICLDRVLSDVSHGYLYLVEDSYRYFDQAYVDELDAQIRTYSAAGAKVYLQFLLSSADTKLSAVQDASRGSDYVMPDIFSEDVLPLICGFSEFFAERYVDDQSGRIHGIIVGKQVDRREMNDCGDLPLLDYAERYAFYVMVVANSARFYQSDLDILVPLGSVNVYSETPVTVATGDYSPTELLEALLKYFETTLSMPFSFNLLMESSSVPFGISNQLLEKETISMESQPSDTVHAVNIQDVLRYISALSNRFKNAPQHLMYVWSVPKELSGDALACAYAYSYYRLLQDSEISAFVVSFSDAEQQDERRISDLEKILRYINTKESFATTEYLLPYFNASDWVHVVNGLDANEVVAQTIFRSFALESKKEKWRGSFSYFDFKSGNLGEWVRGISCKNIKSSYDADGNRGLCATMQSNARAPYAEALCLYEYPENFVYTPFVKFTVQLTDTVDTKDSLYEITVTVGNGKTTVVSGHIVGGNQTEELWLDLSEFNQETVANSIKLTARMISGDAEEYSLWLYDVTGVSEEYTSEELSSRIAMERLNIRNQSIQNENTGEKRDIMWKTFGVLLAITAIGFGLYMVLRRSRISSEGEEKKNERNPS